MNELGRPTVERARFQGIVNQVVRLWLRDRTRARATLEGFLVAGKWRVERSDSADVGRWKDLLETLRGVQRVLESPDAEKRLQEFRDADPARLNTDARPGLTPAEAQIYMAILVAKYVDAGPEAREAIEAVGARVREAIHA